MRQMILKENCRSDGRRCDQIRPIDIEHLTLPRTHGSALFTRGETQALAVCTLGGETMGQRFENLDGEDKPLLLAILSSLLSPSEKSDAWVLPGRREIGHGKLAERALSMIVPNHEHFPYVIRLESNITESNGSSSMASVCGGCLAMMDAGVPIKRPIAGIAMGLILEGDRLCDPLRHSRHRRCSGRHGLQNRRRCRRDHRLPTRYQSRRDHPTDHASSPRSSQRRDGSIS